MRVYEKRGLWWPTSWSREHLAKLLAFSRTQDSHTEVIAVYSPYLRDLGREEWTDASAEFLGIDVISVGEWSLLQMFEAADIALPARITALVNEAGLLSEVCATQYVEDFYRELSEQGYVEPIASVDSRIPVESISVFS